jgi:hypothetical protein
MPLQPPLDPKTEQEAVEVFIDLRLLLLRLNSKKL